MRFYPSTTRHFQESEGGPGILFMKKPVEIVHLVIRAKKCCCKAPLGLVTVFLKKTAYLSLFWRTCV